MSSFSIWHWLIVLIVVALILVSVRRAGGADGRPGLRGELNRVPVYSAETVNRKEAEFIRDQLPARVPPVMVLAALAIVVTLTWWLTR